LEFYHLYLFYQCLSLVLSLTSYIECLTNSIFNNSVDIFVCYYVFHALSWQNSLYWHIFGAIC